MRLHRRVRALSETTKPTEIEVGEGLAPPEITVRLNPSIRIFFYLFYMLVTAFYYVTVEYGRSKPLPYLG